MGSFCTASKWASNFGCRGWLQPLALLCFAATVSRSKVHVKIVELFAAPPLWYILYNRTPFHFISLTFFYQPNFPSTFISAQFHPFFSFILSVCHLALSGSRYIHLPMLREASGAQMDRLISSSYVAEVVGEGSLKWLFIKKSKKASRNFRTSWWYLVRGR